MNEIEKTEARTKPWGCGVGSRIGLFAGAIGVTASALRDHPKDDWMGIVVPLIPVYVFTLILFILFLIQCKKATPQK